MSVDPLNNVTVLILCGLLGMFLTFWVALISASVEKIRMARWASIAQTAKEQRAEARQRAEELYREHLIDPNAPYDQTRDQEPGSV